MMNCEKVSVILHEFVDGLLDGDQAKAVEEHVASCPDCAGHLRELKLINRALGGLDELEPPSDRMWAALNSRIKFEPVYSKPKVVLVSKIDRLVEAVVAHWRIFGSTLVTAVLLMGFWVPHILWTPGRPGARFIIRTELGRDIDEMNTRMQLDIMADAFEIASSEARWAMIDEEFRMGRDDVLSLIDSSEEDNSVTLEETGSLD